MNDNPDCYQVLLVEDNPGDVRLIRRALTRGRLPTELHVAHDGPEALACLAWFRPDLILLDLSLPKMDGCEVLAHIKQDAHLAAVAAVPIVVLSSSQAEGDVMRCYEHAANCFITKPLDLDRYMAVIGSVQYFWLTRARAPGNGTHG
jgi:two-component system, chemotaxis family, response regulator Rcp1